MYKVKNIYLDDRAEVSFVILVDWDGKHYILDKHNFYYILIHYVDVELLIEYKVDGLLRELREKNPDLFLYTSKSVDLVQMSVVTGAYALLGYYMFLEALDIGRNLDMGFLEGL